MPAHTVRAIRPQPGPQETFLSTPADIAIYGGSAGGGKTWALLMEPLRHVGNPHFGAVIFRRTTPQIRNEGGLWDEAQKLYPIAGAEARETPLDWRFPSGAKVKFAHLQYESDKLAWQGSQIPLIEFDELTHFTESQFFYLLSRNRSTCGIRPYVRGSTNPDANSWVKVFLAPWLDRKHKDPAASGEVRSFVRDGGLIEWVPQGTPDSKTVTFVRASIHDNQELLRVDPGYLANLKALSVVDRARLLDGDWDIVADGNMFRREWFPIVEAVPPKLRLVRAWDFAATKLEPGKDPDWTVGVLAGKGPETPYFILDVRRLRGTPGEVENFVRRTAEEDRAAHGPVEVLLEQEGGSSGVAVLDHYVRKVLAGFDVRGEKPTGDKETRAKPFSAQAEAKNVHLKSGAWIGDYLNELVAFPTKGVHDDQVDGTSAAINRLSSKRKIEMI